MLAKLAQQFIVRQLARPEKPKHARRVSSHYVQDCYTAIRNNVVWFIVEDGLAQTANKWGCLPLEHELRDAGPFGEPTRAYVMRDMVCCGDAMWVMFHGFPSRRALDGAEGSAIAHPCSHLFANFARRICGSADFDGECVTLLSKLAHLTKAHVAVTGRDGLIRHGAISRFKLSKKGFELAGGKGEKVGHLLSPFSCWGSDAAMPLANEEFQVVIERVRAVINVDVTAAGRARDRLAAPRHGSQDQVDDRDLVKVETRHLLSPMSGRFVRVHAHITSPTGERLQAINPIAVALGRLARPRCFQSHTLKDEVAQPVVKRRDDSRAKVCALSHFGRNVLRTAEVDRQRVGVVVAALGLGSLRRLLAIPFRDEVAELKFGAVHVQSPVVRVHAHITSPTGERLQGVSA